MAHGRLLVEHLAASRPQLFLELIVDPAGACELDESVGRDALYNGCDELLEVQLFWEKHCLLVDVNELLIVPSLETNGVDDAPHEEK
jgi:hypothetical protein